MKCFGQRNENYHCKIVFLDETELLQEIQSTTRGQDLLDVAFKHLNLLETAYFGLRYLDSTNQTHWLDPTKKVAKQLKGTEQFTLYFGVKFYSSDPCKLLEEITRYQFFLQVKQDVLQGRLPVAFDLAAELGAYAVQSELGDYDPRRHQPGYTAEFRFITPQTHELESRIGELHKSITGQVPAVSELNYLDKVKWLDMYGVDLHPVLGEDNVEYFLGLTPSGVIVLRNRTKVGNYFWPRITKVYFKGKYFMLRVRDKNNDENTYGFELPSKQACKHLWKCCVEHHAFFRLTQVSSTNSGKMFSLTSRFSSGRSERQVQSESPPPNRLQPTVTRISSRRYQRRLGQPDGIDNSLKEDNREGERMETRSNLSIPQPIHLSSIYRTTSTPNTAIPDSPRSTRSAPWEDPRQRGLFSSSTNPSPRSVRSAGHKQSSRSHSRHRSPSADSEDSCDSRRKRHHPHSGHHSSGHRHQNDKRHQSRRNSDNDSERSQGSKCSHSRSHSRKHRSSSRHRDSGSDSEPTQKHRHRGRRHRSGAGSNYELVDSEAQWKEVQSKQQKVVTQQTTKPQSAVIRDLSAAPRKSGYVNSGLESESEMTYMHRNDRRKHRKQRSRSRSPSESKKGPPEELKKHFQYNLKDQVGLSTDQLRDIPYTKVETDAKPYKVKYSPNSKQKQIRPSGSSVSNGHASSERKSSSRVGEEEDPPPPYSLMTGHGGHSTLDRNSEPRFTSSPTSSTRSRSTRNGVVGSSNNHIAEFSQHNLDLLPNHFQTNTNGSLASRTTERNKKNSMENLLGGNRFNSLSLNHDHSDSGVGTENQDRLSGNSTGSYHSSASQSPNHFNHNGLPPTTSAQQQPVFGSRMTSANGSRQSLRPIDGYHSNGLSGSQLALNGKTTYNHDSSAAYLPHSNHQPHYNTTTTSNNGTNGLPVPFAHNTPAKPPLVSSTSGGHGHHQQPPFVVSSNRGSTCGLPPTAFGRAQQQQQLRGTTAGYNGAANGHTFSAGQSSNLMSFHSPPGHSDTSSVARSPALGAINRHALPLHRQEIVKASPSLTSLGGTSLANGHLSNGGGVTPSGQNYGHHYPQTSLSTSSHMSAYHSNMYAPSYNWPNSKSETNKEVGQNNNLTITEKPRSTSNGDGAQTENNHEMSTEL